MKMTTRHWKGTDQRYQRFRAEGGEADLGEIAVIDEVFLQFRDGEILRIVAGANDAPNGFRPAGDFLGAMQPCVVLVEDVAIVVKVDLFAAGESPRFVGGVKDGAVRVPFGDDVAIGILLADIDAAKGVLLWLDGFDQPRAGILAIAVKHLVEVIGVVLALVIWSIRSLRI